MNKNTLNIITIVFLGVAWWFGAFTGFVYLGIYRNLLQAAMENGSMSFSYFARYGIFVYLIIPVIIALLVYRGRTLPAAAITGFFALYRAVFIVVQRAFKIKIIAGALLLAAAAVLLFYASKYSYALEGKKKSDLTLGDYSRMYEEGSISKEEFEEKKREILGM